MAELSPLEVSTWIKKLSPSFKEALIPFGLSCIFPYHQIKVDEPLLRVAAKFWIPTWHVFHFNGVEICTLLKSSMRSMVNLRITFSFFLLLAGILLP